MTIPRSIIMPKADAASFSAFMTFVHNISWHVDDPVKDYVDEQGRACFTPAVAEKLQEVLDQIILEGSYGSLVVQALKDFYLFERTRGIRMLAYVTDGHGCFLLDLEHLTLTPLDPRGEVEPLGYSALYAGMVVGQFLIPSVDEINRLARSCFFANASDALATVDHRPGVSGFAVEQLWSAIDQ